MESENLLDVETFSKYKINKLQASPREALRVSAKQNLVFPLGPVTKCLLSQIYFLPTLTQSKVALYFCCKLSLLEFLKCMDYGKDSSWSK